MEPFKNNFSPELVLTIADHLEKHLDGFDRSLFENSILNDLNKLELKERSQLITDHLHNVLPRDYKTRYKILLAILHPVCDADINLQSDQDGIRGWGTLPLCGVVGQHGLDTFEESLLVLKEMTSRFSSEFDIRYFLIADQKRTLDIISPWTDDPNHHVRRLVSEGTRPRLPWAMQLPQLIADPSPILPLLEALRDDDEEYVRRSVANHLNDISKDHPDLVAQIAKSWMEGADKNQKKLLRHACRSLIKQGHPQTLNVFGYKPTQIKLKKLEIKRSTVILGSSLEFSVEIKSTSRKPQKLLIDYLLHFKKKNNALSPKVFKWTQISLDAGDEITLTRRHPIRAITTRKYYPGEQAISLRINGQDFGHTKFQLQTI